MSVVCLHGLEFNTILRYLLKFLQRFLTHCTLLVFHQSSICSTQCFLVCILFCYGSLSLINVYVLYLFTSSFNNYQVPFMSSIVVASSFFFCSFHYPHLSQVFLIKISLYEQLGGNFVIHMETESRWVGTVRHVNRGLRAFWAPFEHWGQWFHMCACEPKLFKK